MPSHWVHLVKGPDIVTLDGAEVLGKDVSITQVSLEAIMVFIFLDAWWKHN
ncbi:MAG: hypothetical protein WBE34_06015 [Candidatus Nitrosopolaris sp.]